jgi:hypothetical protein
MSRYKKTINMGENTEESILGFSIFQGGKERREYMMFHYLNRVEFYSAAQEKFVSKIFMTLGKRNLIIFKSTINLVRCEKNFKVPSYYSSKYHRFNFIKDKMDKNDETVSLVIFIHIVK